MSPTYEILAICGFTALVTAPSVVNPYMEIKTANPLSPRERQTLLGLLRGDSEKQLAARIGVQRTTAHTYIKSLYLHYGVCTRAELMALFLRETVRDLEASRNFTPPPRASQRKDDQPMANFKKTSRPIRKAAQSALCGIQTSTRINMGVRQDSSDGSPATPSLAVPSALALKGKTLHERGKLNEAEKAYNEALDADPEDAEAMHFLGMLYSQRGQGAAALELMLRSVVLSPQSSEFYCNLGIVLGRGGSHKQAIEALDRAIALRPSNADAYDNRGMARQKLGQVDGAVEDWRRAIELSPQAHLPRLHLGKALLKKGEAAEAAEHLREAVTLRPKHPEAHNLLGCALRRLGQGREAIVEFRKSLQYNAASPDALNNLGTALADMGRPHESIPYLQKAVEIKPSYAEAHWNLALALLSCGQFQRGWLEYEWREIWKPDKNHRKLVQPRWNGCDIAGRTILLIGEQGLGDTLQFARYAPIIAEMGARVIVECQPQLCELLRGVKGISQIITAGDRYPAFDTHAKLMSLPGMLRAKLGNIPADVPYLQPDPHRESEWKQRITGGGFKIGIAWQGNQTFPGDKTRSISLAHFEPLAKLEGVRLMSLQKNFGTEQIAEVKDHFAVEQFDPPLDEGTGAFVDTAAVMRQLDLVITSDTAIAHLAGALGVKVWVALPTNCDWRWLRDREDSPWYPTMRLFRKQQAGDWNSVFAAIARAIQREFDLPAHAPACVSSVPMSPGNLVDRITILRIKSAKLQDAADVAAVNQELALLENARDEVGAASAAIADPEQQLEEVNRRLWDVEDELRACEARSDFGDQFIELARSVYRLNDQRANLKRQIDRAMGSTLTEVKKYAAYGVPSVPDQLEAIG